MYNSILFLIIQFLIIQFLLENNFIIALLTDLKEGKVLQLDDMRIFF